MSEPEDTGEEQNSNLFKPGQSGNPKGRPRGSRNKLGEAFISALHDDFLKHGVKAIETVRDDRPHEYLKVVASILPKQLEIREAAFGEFTDDQLAALITFARNALGVAEGGGERTGQALN